MKTTERNESVLPTGSWLAQERQRLGMTLADVAMAVQGHHSTIRAMEQNNRVLPPGWYPSLQKLGMSIPEPQWDAQMQPYRGADLHEDLQNRVGFRHSRYWLSKQLDVSESAVTDVIRSNLQVPPSWMLKLAELGANVPDLVQLTLATRVSPRKGPETAAPGTLNVANVNSPNSINARWNQVVRDLKTAQRESNASTPVDPESPPKNSGGSTRAEPSPPPKDAPLNKPQAPVKVPVPASTRRERGSVYLHWTEDGGLHFSMSALVLEQLPSVLGGILINLVQSGLLGSSPEAGTPGSRA